MDYFMDVTVKIDANEYINKLNDNVLLIYSPTSISKIHFINEKVKKINWHSISKNLENIEEYVKELENIKEVVTFGGGSTIDIGKYIAFKLNIKYTCIPSMLSTNSYATNKVALIENNKKITLEAKLPDSIIVDKKILDLSKTENLYGLADVLSIYTALYDWKLAEADIHENIDNQIYTKSIDLLNQVLEYILKNNYKTISKDSIKLYEYIGIAGYITNVYGSGRPESGSEHIFAKQLESMIDVPHGISVSLGILFMSIMQERYSEKIKIAIDKIKVLEKKEAYGVNENIIKICTSQLKPRDGRYTIVDKYCDNQKYIKNTIEEFLKRNIV